MEQEEATFMIHGDGRAPPSLLPRSVGGEGESGMAVLEALTEEKGPAGGKI